MNKYTKQGRGRNRSEQRPFGLSGLARRLLARNDLSIAVLPVLDAPHQIEPEISAREDRRHHGAVIRYSPQKVDPLLGRSATEVTYGGPRKSLPEWQERRQYERAMSNPYFNLYDSPTGRLARSPDQAEVYRLMYSGARQIGQSTRHQQFLDGLIATERAEQQVQLVNPVQFGTRGLRVQRSGMVIFDTEMINRPLQSFAESFARVGEAITEAFRLVAGSPAFQELTKAEQEAAEKAEIEKRLAGRTPGEVIRRPRRSILGMYVIDEVQEDGHIARKVVQPQGKKGSS